MGAVGVLRDGRLALGPVTQTSTLTGPAAANTVFSGMRFVSGRMPSGGVDFAGATVSIAIGGAETSLVLRWGFTRSREWSVRAGSDWRRRSTSGSARSRP
jgi:hypothetical protein